MRTKALVVGSVAYDVVFEVYNIFRDEVVLEQNQLKGMSMMLTAKNKQIFFGGTGGNIAYGLGLLAAEPLLFSVVGGDFAADYQVHLENYGVELKLVDKPDEFTATFYAVSDQRKEQIGIFQPNTHGDYMDAIRLEDRLRKTDFAEIKVAIFAPGTGISMRNHMQQLRTAAGSAPVIIFDPSQVLSIFFTPELLKECLSMSNIFIGNETEIAQLQQLLEMPLSAIFDIGLGHIIETMGQEGSMIYTKKAKQHVKPHTANQFVEQTGAGDAYRAGFIKGLLDNKSIEECCDLGSFMGARNVETAGGQKYRLVN